MKKVRVSCVTNLSNAATMYRQLQPIYCEVVKVSGAANGFPVCAESSDTGVGRLSWVNKLDACAAIL